MVTPSLSDLLNKLPVTNLLDTQRVSRKILRITSDVPKPISEVERQKHICEFQDLPKPEEYDQRPDETKREYKDWLRKRAAWPERSAAMDAEWICHGKTALTCLKFAKHIEQARRIYHHAWVCFRAAKYTGREPFLHTPDGQRSTDFYIQQGEQLERYVHKEWVKGRTLTMISTDDELRSTAIFTLGPLDPASLSMHRKRRKLTPRSLGIRRSMRLRLKKLKLTSKALD